MRSLFCSGNLVLALGVFLHGCGQPQQPGPSPEAVPFPGAPAVGQPAPEIAGTDLDGVPFKLSDYRGGVVVLDFWAGW
jgi:hypothetical protein